MKKNSLLLTCLAVLLLFLSSVTMASAAPVITIGDAVVSPGQKGFTVDVTIDDGSSADIRGAEVNIGYNADILTFKSGTHVDGTWMIKQVQSSTPDDSNTETGQVKILLAAMPGDGISASTASVLARLTFDISDSASNLTYPLTYLSSSPGLKDMSNAPISSTSANGTISVTGIPTGAITLTPSEASIVANGSTTSTITSGEIKDAGNTNVPDGTKITVSTNLGTITTADADAVAPGFQVLTASGIISFELTSSTTAGTATVSANSLAGDATGTTTVTLTPGPVSAAQSTVIASKSSETVSMTGGIDVTVTLKDANNNLISGKDVSLSMSGTNNLINDATVTGPYSIGTTNASGVVTAKITSIKAENKTITATVEGTPMEQKPQVTFTPDVAVASTSSIDPAGMPLETITADIAPFSLTLTLKDKHGNKLIGASTKALTAEGSKLSAGWAVVDNNDGTATLTYTPNKAGTEDALTVSIDGTPISVLPFDVAPGVATAANSSVTAISPATIIPGETATATVTFRDQKGNETDNIFGLTLFQSGEKLAGAGWVVVDNPSSTAIATYTPGNTGIGDEDALEVTLGGTRIGSLLSVTVEPDVAVAAQSTISAISNDSITADDTATVTINLKDQYGNDTGKLGSLSLDTSDAQLENAAWSVGAVTGTTATATYTPGKAGSENALQIKLGADQIGTNRSITVTPGAPVIANSSVSAFAPSATIDADGSATVTVSIKDAKGNEVEDLGGKVLKAEGAKKTGATWAINLRTATYTPSESGEENELKILLGDDQIGNDLSLTINPGAVNSVELSSTSSVLASQGNGSATVTATLKDQHGNICTNDSASDVAFSIAPATYLQFKTTPATVTATSGKATIDIETFGAEVPDSTKESVTATISGVTPATIEIGIVNFSIGLVEPGNTFVHGENGKLNLIVGDKAPNYAVLNGMGSDSGNYRWSLSGPGTLDSTDQDQIRYTTPATLGDIDEATITLTSAKVGEESYEATLVIKLSNPISITNPAQPSGIALDNTEFTIVPAGGTGAYSYSSSDSEVATVSLDGKITPKKAGTFTVAVTDGDFNTASVDNGFKAVSEVIEVITPITIEDLPANDAMASQAVNTFTASGGKVDGSIDWEATDGAITPEGEFTAPTLAAGETKVVTITAFDKTYNKAHATPVKSEYEVTVFGQVAVTPAGDIGMAKGTTQTFDATGGNIANGDNTWTMVPATGVGTLAEKADDSKADFTATATGTVKITVTDDKGLSATTGTITVVEPVSITTTPASLEAGDTKSFAAVGGTSTYVWSTNIGTIDAATGIYEAPSVASATPVEVKASDSSFANIFGTISFTVYPALAIGEKPAGPVTVESGKSSAEFTVSGGDDSGDYTWTVAGPVPMKTVTNDKYKFTAPTTGYFAGSYVITVTDDQGFEDSFTVLVPVKAVPASSNFEDIDIYSDVDNDPNVQDFILKGTDGDPVLPIEILTSKDAEVAVENPEAYGTFDMDAGKFTPARVEAITEFFVRITIENDDDLTEANGLNKIIAGPYRIIPVKDYVVTVTKEDGITPIVNAMVSVEEYYDNHDDSDAADAPQKTDINGQYTFKLPDMGTAFEYEAEMADHVSQNVIKASSVQAIEIKLPETGGVITGIVTAKDGGSTLSDIKVVAYHTSAESVLYEAYTNGEGVYELEFPAGAALDSWTIVALPESGYKSMVKEAIAMEAVDVNFALKSKRTIDVDKNGQNIKVTGDPKFTGDAEIEIYMSQEDGTFGDTALNVDLNTDDPDYPYYKLTNGITEEKCTLKLVSGTNGNFETQIFFFGYIDSPDEEKVVSKPVGLGGDYLAPSENDDEPEYDLRVSVPFNGINAKDETTGESVPVTIVLKAISKKDGVETTKGCPGLIFDIDAIRNDNGMPVSNNDIRQLEISIPIDLSVVTLAKLKSGELKILYAESVDKMNNGNVNSVPYDNIMLEKTDMIGKNGIGLLTFHVDHLTVFGVGSVTSTGGSGGGGCFIGTTAAGPASGIIYSILAMLATAAMGFIRRK